MQAIDFATRLTARLLKYNKQISLMDAGVLFAICAGLDYYDDIAATLARPQSVTVPCLHRLAKMGLIHANRWTDDGTPLYSLTHDGKDAVANLLNFKKA